MSPAVGVEAATLDQKIHHGGHPILRWQTTPRLRSIRETIAPSPKALDRPCRWRDCLADGNGDFAEDRQGGQAVDVFCLGENTMIEAIISLLIYICVLRLLANTSSSGFSGVIGVALPEKLP
jgi:hypothetical protein